jgi:hypothetical protein
VTATPDAIPSAIHDRENEQYHLLVKELFAKRRHIADDMRIRFATRGNKTRNSAFGQALKQAAETSR